MTEANRQAQVDAASAWAGQLEAWIDVHGLRGYDPFDVKAHPLVRAVQPYALLRKAASAALDVFPMTARRVLRVQPSLNAKAFALTALAELRLYQTTGAPAHLDRAIKNLDWLRSNPCPPAHGLAWGYPFDVSGKNMYRPAGTPVGVVSAVAGEAFALAFRITGDTAYRDAVRDIATFFLTDINRMAQEDGTVCFSYTTVDRWRVHNANLHAVAHLYRAAAVTGDAVYRHAAEPALRFTLQAQRPDGAWTYGVWSPGEPYEKALLAQIDHFHTGFVLRSLDEIRELTGDAAIEEAVRKGYAFYKANLFTADGAPRMTTKSTYPINIHSCAEGILCPAVLGDFALAGRTLEWTRAHMAHPRTGLPYYRKYPWLTNRLLATRWGLAWMFYALAEFMWRAKN